MTVLSNKIKKCFIFLYKCLVTPNDKNDIESIFLLFVYNLYFLALAFN